MREREILTKYNTVGKFINLYDVNFRVLVVSANPLIDEDLVVVEAQLHNEVNEVNVLLFPLVAHDDGPSPQLSQQRLDGLQALVSIF